MHASIGSLRSALAKLGRKTRRRSRRPAWQRPRRLLLEGLEARHLLATVGVALGQNAAEGGQVGYVTFTRDDTEGSLNVYYGIDEYSSTAGGSDYTGPTPYYGYVTFPSGQASVNLNVTAVDDSEVESSESLVISVRTARCSDRTMTSPAEAARPRCGSPTTTWPPR